jgi:hypothetical protein
MAALERLFRSPRPLVGMVHLLPLPGAPRYGGSMGAVVRRALADARAIEEGGLDALIVENYGDAPFLKADLPPETVAALTRCVTEVMRAVTIPVGVNALRNDARAGLAICAATGARFIRVNVHVGAQLTDQGIVEGRAAETARLRAALCPDAGILADVGVKHSAPLAERPLSEEASDAVHRGLADVIVVTGSATGRAADSRDYAEAAKGGAPVFAGSGVTERTARAVLRQCDGVIVGTAIKRGGIPDAEVDPARARAFVARARG